MATYYLEARKIAKEMKQRAEENKRKAERRAEIADNQVGSNGLPADAAAQSR